MPTNSSPLLDSLRQRGFRPWYERELLLGHAHLVLGLLCFLGALASVEIYADARHLGGADLGDALALGLCLMAGIWSFRQYGQRLSLAEFIAHQASCPQCGRYARWTCLQCNAQGLEVVCKDCQRHWRIEA